MTEQSKMYHFYVLPFFLKNETSFCSSFLNYFRENKQNLLFTHIKHDTPQFTACLFFIFYLSVNPKKLLALSTYIDTGSDDETKNCKINNYQLVECLNAEILFSSLFTFFLNVCFCFIAHVGICFVSKSRDYVSITPYKILLYKSA